MTEKPVRRSAVTRPEPDEDEMEAAVFVAAYAQWTAAARVSGLSVLPLALEDDPEDAVDKGRAALARRGQTAAANEPEPEGALVVYSLPAEAAPSRDVRDLSKALLSALAIPVSVEVERAGDMTAQEFAIAGSMVLDEAWVETTAAASGATPREIIEMARGQRPISPAARVFVTAATMLHQKCWPDEIAAAKALCQLVEQDLSIGGDRPARALPRWEDGPIHAN